MNNPIGNEKTKPLSSLHKLSFVFLSLTLFANYATAKTKTTHAVKSAAPTPEPSPTPNPSLDVPDDSVNDLPSLSLDRDGAITLTLDSSVKLAIHAATNVLFAQNSSDISGATLLQSYGQFLPNVSAQGNYAFSRGNQYFTTADPVYVSGSSLSAGYSISSDLNIFNGLYDIAHLKASILRRDASDLTLFRAKQAIALDVTQSYLTVVLDSELVEIARKNLQESQAREKLLLEQTRVGVKNLSDLFRQQAQTSQDEALVLNSDNKERQDQIALLQKLRLDVSKSYHLVDPQLPEEKSDSRFADETELLKSAAGHRTDLKSSIDSAKAAHWDTTGASSGYLPKLDLVGSIGTVGHYLYSQTVSGVGNVVPPNQTNIFNQLPNQMEYSLGLYLTWNIFDRFVTNQTLTTAQANARNADIQSVDENNQVQADVRLAYGNYKTAIQQLRTSKKGQEAAKKAYEVIEGRYEVGSATFIDLVTVQADLLQAETARAQALINFTLQAKSVEFATGLTVVD